MPAPNSPRPNWWITIGSILFAIAVVFWAVFFGGGQPPPGDVIILHPDPIDPFKPNSGYWTIGGDSPKIQYEPQDSVWLNTNAFTYIYGYPMRAQKDGAGPIQKIEPPDELRASFGHCSDYYATKILTPCEKNTDCTSGTCDISKLRVTYETGARQKLHWYLTPSEGEKEIELQPFDYKDPTYWRGELCGQLIGKIEGSYSGATYVVPSPYGSVSIQAEP